jgi:hypothetical protein
MGTSALFTDEETFEGNSITAGTTNLIVRAELVAQDSSVDLFDDSTPGYVEIVDPDGEVDGEAGIGISATDIKPGDSFVVCLEVEVDDNPMYVGVEAEKVNDLENGFEEPEPNPGTDSDGGELDDKMDVVFGADANSDPDANDGSYNGNITDVEFSDSLAAFTQISQVYRGDGTNGGAPGHWDSGDQGTGPVTAIGDGSNADVDSVVHYAEFSLPDTVGNDVMGDSVEWNMTWYAEQVRNNDPPTAVSDLSDGSPN